MLDEKDLKRIKENVEKSIKLGEIIKENKALFAEFFMNNAKNSLESAKLLFKASYDGTTKKFLGLVDFNGYLWVINASYYSMFYMARALLESQCIGIKADQSIHQMTFNAFTYYFYLSGKLEKELVEDLKEAGEEASEILGKEQAKGLVEDYFNEKGKRGRFTYEMGEIAIKAKAQTSLERAKRFNEEIRKRIELRR